MVPEFIPFKYNSFPVNGARQSHRLTVALQAQIARLARESRLTGLPPILTFQSVIDFTVSTRAIVTALYARLPANGSELVLFDLNRTVKFGPLLRVTFDTDAGQAPAAAAPRLPHHGRHQCERRHRRGRRARHRGRCHHGAVARPRPLLSGRRVLALASGPALPDERLALWAPAGGRAEFGIELGAMAARGERGALIISLESLMRMTSNPFFSFMIEPDRGRHRLACA